MSGNLKIEFPSQGWKQLLTSRKEILDAYDRGREQSKSHKVQTFHGNVAEASCRKWLSSFLPKKYGVTSGYVVSTGLKSEVKTPHFDVIIYDQLESPVLWVEDDPDRSSQGRSMAIPVEYVCGVIEVKSSFDTRNVKDALEHLEELLPVMNGTNDSNERYKLHLPNSFYCGTIFVELREKEFHNEIALSSIIEGRKLRGFFGGLILRTEGNAQNYTGCIRLTQSEQSIQSIIPKKTEPLRTLCMSKSIQIEDKVHIGSMIMWSESGFAQFGFDLIAMMQGNYETGRISSFYGMGSSQAELNKK